MGLTPEGERVVEWAGHILTDYESLKQDVAGFRGCLKGTLRLGVIPAAMPVVAKLTTPFSVKHPQVAIDVLSMSSAEIQRALDKFEIEAGLTYLENEPLSNVRRTPLYREKYLFVTSRSSPRARAGTISWNDAAQSNLCLLHESMQNRRVLNNLARSIGLKLAPTVTTNSFLAICSHVCSGEWSSIIPHTFAYIFAGCDDLAMLDLVDPVHRQTIGMVATDRDPFPPLAQALIRCGTRLNLESAFKASTFEPA